MDVAEHDAPVTTRVKGAGAVVMAKTNVPQMLADWQSVSLLQAVLQAVALAQTKPPVQAAAVPGLQK